MSITLFTALTAAEKVSITMACITAVSAVVAISGLMYTWFSGKWHTEERVNKARRQITKFLYQNWKFSGMFKAFKSPYINPLTYYKEIGQYRDDDGKPVLLDAISIQTKDMNTLISRNIINTKANIFYGHALTTVGLYNEPNKMTFRNVKRFNGLIAFVDKQLNDYLHARDNSKQSMWNMKKWKAFLRILRKKLILIRKELEALEVNEIKIKLNPDANKVIDKSKMDLPDYFSIDPHSKDSDPEGTFEDEFLSFFYSFDMYDFSGIKDEFTKGASIKNYPFNNIVKLMSDFPGFYEREHTAAFRKQVWDTFYVDLDLHMELKQSHSDYNMKRANDALKEHDNELKKALRKILKDTVFKPGSDEAQDFMSKTHIAINEETTVEELIANEWKNITADDLTAVVPFMKNMPHSLVKDIRDELWFEGRSGQNASAVIRPEFLSRAAKERAEWRTFYKNYKSERVQSLLQYGAQAMRHLVLTSDSIKFDVHKNPYYVSPASKDEQDQNDWNVLLTTKGHEALVPETNKEYLGDIDEQIRNADKDIYLIGWIKFKYFLKKTKLAFNRWFNFSQYKPELRNDSKYNAMKAILIKELLKGGVANFIRNLKALYKYRQVVKNRVRGFREKHTTQLNTLRWAIAKDFLTLKWIKFWTDLKTKSRFARKAKQRLSGFEIRNIIIDDLQKGLPAIDATVDEGSKFMDGIDKLILLQLMNFTFLKTYPSLGSLEEMPYFTQTINKTYLNDKSLDDGVNNKGFRDRWNKRAVKPAKTISKYAKYFLRFNKKFGKDKEIYIDNIKTLLIAAGLDIRFVNQTTDKIVKGLSKVKNIKDARDLISNSIKKTHNEYYPKTLNDPFVFDNERMMAGFIANNQNKKINSPGIIYNINSNAFYSYLRHANYFPETESLREREEQIAHRLFDKGSKSTEID